MPRQMNLNDEVLVQLTPKGEEVLKTYFTTLLAGGRGKNLTLEPDEFIRVTEAPGGHRKFQLYILMNIFGPEMITGSMQVFKNNEIVVL